MKTSQTGRQNDQLTPFIDGDRAVRTVMIDDSPWFIAKDVCDILELTNHRKAIGNLPENEKGVTTGYTPGGKQEMLTVNEPGLYRLIFQSRKPEAERFKTWVFTAVLPQIRRTGVYIQPGLTLMDRIYRVFINEEDMGLQRILKLLDMATAKSAFTGEYVKAVDVAAAVMRGMKNRPTAGQLAALAAKVTEVRHIVEQSETPLPRYRFAGGVYKETLPCNRPSFPLELPEKEAGHVQSAS
jgi:prophage antirepressor-like protein